ncbi:MAG: hypothetical protein ABI604_21020, partial [Nitrospirota bacterium]
TFHKSQWNGSGEIPLRAVTDGTIARFGAIDPSEGGKTLRSTANVNYHYDTTSGGQFFAENGHQLRSRLPKLLNAPHRKRAALAARGGVRENATLPVLSPLAAWPWARRVSARQGWAGE